MTCPPDFPNVESVDDLSATAVTGDMCWVRSTEEVWICMGGGDWMHQPPRPPAPPVKVYHAKGAP